MYEKGDRVRKNPRTLHIGTVRRVEYPMSGTGRSYPLVYVKWDGEEVTRELLSDIAPLSDLDVEHGWE